MHRRLFPNLLSCAITLAAVAMMSSAAAEDAPSQSGYTLSGKDAEALVSHAMVSSGAGNSIKAQLSGIGVQEGDTIAAAAAPIETDVSDLDVDKAHSRWQATLLMKADGKNLAPVKLAGHYEEVTQVPVLKRSIHPGEVISADDVTVQEQPVSYLRKNTVLDAAGLIGKSPKHTVSLGRPVREDEIANPAVITKGARVTLMYKSNDLVIKTLGEAMDSGAPGEVIRVKNVESKQIIQGTVQNGELVRVTSPDSTSAEAM